MSQEIHNKLDRMVEAQFEMKIELTRYNALLDEHIRRTEINEKQIEEVENRIEKKADKAFITWAIALATTLVGLAILLAKMPR